MFFNWFLSSFRILLFPFSLLFALVIWVRNYLFDKDYLKSSAFNLPIICVGNISVGGTGKSPMVEFLVKQLKDQYKVATLSRGYKRKTRGYALAGEDSTALDIGDEPMQFHQKFPGVPVAVGEQRVEAIPQLLHDHPETEVILLDDAFQHRSIRAGFNVILTDYNNLYTRDFFLPAGDLRDLPSSLKRAQVIIVTKCPLSLSEKERDALLVEIDPLPSQYVYFSTIAYGDPYHITRKEVLTLDDEKEILLVTGIANPRPLKKLLEDRTPSYYMLHYNDHHIFTIDDWKDIRKAFGKIDNPQKMVLTTEKDAMRLMKFGQEINGMPFYVIPIEHKFLFNQEAAFKEQTQLFIEKFKQPA
jgi:tetraacyldisaccharide 4'-kinase